jgi:hypothetical protein
MRLNSYDLQTRGTASKTPVREELSVPFDDLLFMLAESVATAQTKLDMNTAEVLETLAETDVEIVPQLTKTVAADGSVTTEPASPETRSLLELGFTPTRYQFSEATVDVSVDISISEQDESETDEEGHQFGLRAGTYELTKERTYSREINANAQISATLAPTPLPVDLQPADARETAETNDGDQQ